ncbi:MAG: hypothetical protein SFW36_23330 [Leptolyngbyaceae cyanobacterium bins.59]|nr:hypothetical protein [Leptolyngbyaceae cyanobacterium bins.59]
MTAMVEPPMTIAEKGFITILTGLYSFQDCVHFIASVRKFHTEPIVVLIDRVPILLHPLLTVFGNVILKPAPSNPNPVLASRLAKVALYQSAPFEKTIYFDCDICLLANVDEIFESLNEVDLLITRDVRPNIRDAVNLLRPQGDRRVEEVDVLPTLQAVGLPVNENTVQYNGGMMAFKRNALVEELFNKFGKYLQIVMENQERLLLKDQGPFAAAIEATQPKLQVLPPTYNFLSKWKDAYGELQDPVKVLHCTYPMRPQHAKNVTRSLYTRVFDRVARYLLPNQVNNPWRTRKAEKPVSSEN